MKRLDDCRLRIYYIRKQSGRGGEAPAFFKIIFQPARRLGDVSVWGRLLTCGRLAIAPRTLLRIVSPDIHVLSVTTSIVAGCRMSMPSLKRFTASTADGPAAAGISRAVPEM